MDRNGNSCHHLVTGSKTSSYAKSTTSRVLPPPVQVAFSVYTRGTIIQDEQGQALLRRQGWPGRLKVLLRRVKERVSL